MIQRMIPLYIVNVMYTICIILISETMLHMLEILGRVLTVDSTHNTTKFRMIKLITIMALDPNINKAFPVFLTSLTKKLKSAPPLRCSAKCAVPTPVSGARHVADTSAVVLAALFRW